MRVTLWRGFYNPFEIGDQNHRHSTLEYLSVVCFNGPGHPHIPRPSAVWHWLCGSYQFFPNEKALEMQWHSSLCSSLLLSCARMLARSMELAEMGRSKSKSLVAERSSQCWHRQWNCVHLEEEPCRISKGVHKPNLTIEQPMVQILIFNLDSKLIREAMGCSNWLNSFISSWRFVSQLSPQEL